MGFHPFRFGWMNLGIGERLLNERALWLGILAKSSLVSECVERACMRLHVFAIRLGL
jgi:hypothetical protein